MPFLLIIFALFGIASIATPTKQIKVVIIDSGINKKFKDKLKLCKEGSGDTTGTGIEDTNGHGTNIAGLIIKDLENVNYCVIIIKYYSNKNNLRNFKRALLLASEQNPDIINISSNGDVSDEMEKAMIKTILDSGTIINVASGNEGSNLEKKCNAYPACYDERINVIGNTARNSNYGPQVDKIIDGNWKTGFGITLSGTSQSTAIFTNKQIKALANGK